MSYVDYVHVPLSHLSTLSRSRSPGTGQNLAVPLPAIPENLSGEVVFHQVASKAISRRCEGAPGPAIVAFAPPPPPLPPRPGAPRRGGPPGGARLRGGAAAPAGARGGCAPGGGGARREPQGHCGGLPQAARLQRRQRAEAQVPEDEVPDPQGRQGGRLQSGGDAPARGGGPEAEGLAWEDGRTGGAREGQQGLPLLGHRAARRQPAAADCRRCLRSIAHRRAAPSIRKGCRHRAAGRQGSPGPPPLAGGA